MDATLIDSLSTMSPASDMPRITTGEILASRKHDALADSSRDRFLSKYIRPGFGYYIAAQFANARQRLPYPMIGRDAWVHKASLMLGNPSKFFDKRIVEAFHLSRFVKSQPFFGHKLKALLLSFDGKVTWQEHIRLTASRTGVAEDVIDAFEVLFFNVLDRQADALYLAEEVYPDTRAVEFDENYFRTSSLSDIIARVAFNHRDMDLTAYLAGIGDHSYLRKIAADSDRESQLTRFIMGNGLILTHANLLNQNSIGMRRASTLLAASRQSGVVAEEPAMTGIAPLFLGAFQSAAEENKGFVLDQMRADAAQPGSVVDV